MVAVLLYKGHVAIMDCIDCLCGLGVSYLKKIKNLLAKYVAPYNKAIVPVVVLVLLRGLEQVGILGDMSVKEALTLAVTAGLVWLVPNKAYKA